MPNKLKIVLTIVAIVAVFLVYKLAQYVHAVANQNPSLQQTSPLPAADEDADKDGLNNQQEVIWGSDPFNPDTDGDGFKDGEEVNSGHNPLVPGPDDVVGVDNFTQQFSELALAGLAEGSLQPESDKFNQSLADITNAITDSAKYLFGKEFNESAVTTIGATTQTNEAYIKSVSPLLQSFGELFSEQYQNIDDHLNNIGEKGFDDPEIKSYFTNKANSYQEILKKGEGLKVPENLQGAHAQFLTLLLQMQEISNAIAKGDRDPVKATFAFDAFGEVFAKYILMIDLYGNALESINFDPDLIIIPKQ